MRKEVVKLARENETEKLLLVAENKNDLKIVLDKAIERSANAKDLRNSYNFFIKKIVVKVYLITKLWF